MKRVAIIGRGTAGCLAVSHFLRWTDWDIDWYFDPNIKPQAVGEGSNIVLPTALRNNLVFEYYDLDKIDGTLKLAIWKENWGKSGEGFFHTFPVPQVALHFNAIKLQDFIISRVKDNRRLKFYHENITHDEIDCDYIVDCSGKPENYDPFYMSEYIPVNSVHVNQCYWDYPRFQYTLTVARPWGWVFGIPLKNRCSIGYLYNNQFVDVEEVKNDMQNIFKQYNLTPSEDTNSFSFKNYYRMENFSDRVCYNGNASFFLEPLEATSIGIMDHVNRKAFDVWVNNKPLEEANMEYLNFIQETEDMIMLHYYAGSVFNNDFWKYAQARGEKCMDRAVHNKNFRAIVNEATKSHAHFQRDMDYGTWWPGSYKQNLKHLDLKNLNGITVRL